MHIHISYPIAGIIVREMQASVAYLRHNFGLQMFAGFNYHPIYRILNQDNLNIVFHFNAIESRNTSLRNHNFACAFKAIANFIAR